ncbi:hypothetical protein BHM03_00009541 [Ensete ventricosum]|nr:hypothetical protein BHM03_00009541 [Ensete ventricosum]
MVPPHADRYVDRPVASIGVIFAPLFHAEGRSHPGYGLTTVREKDEEGEEKGEPGDPALLFLDDPDPSSPSLPLSTLRNPHLQVENDYKS